VECVVNKRGAQRFLVGNLRECALLEDLDLKGNIILKYIIKNMDGSIDCFDLSQDTVRWQALVNG